MSDPSLYASAPGSGKCKHHKEPLKSWAAVTLIITLVVVLVSSRLITASASEFEDQLNGLDNWTIYRGQQNAHLIIDSSQGWPEPPSFNLPPASTPLATDPPGFDDNVTSLYLSNPSTALLSNFTLDFHIRFDDDDGRAFLTFRMQDDRNYYALRLADTHDWPTAFLKFVGNSATILAQTPHGGVFSPRQWSHVSLEVRANSFSLKKDGSLVLEATDSTWATGRTLGIGIYNGYDHFHIHVDDFSLASEEAMIFVRVLVTTSISTQIETTQTFETLTMSSSVTSFVTTTTSSTYTSTLIQPKVPVADQTLLLIALVALVASVCAGYLKKETVAFVATIVIYEFGVLGFIFTGVSQLWFTFADGVRIILGGAIPPLVGFAFGRIIKNKLER
jgi:hypothetical protein